MTGETPRRASLLPFVPWIASLWAGLPAGLLLSRVLYEWNPLLFDWAGSPLGAAGCGLLGLLIARWLLGAFAASASTSFFLSTTPAGLIWLGVFWPVLAPDPLRGLLLLLAALLLIAIQVLAYHLVVDPLSTEVLFGLLGGIITLAYLLTLQTSVGRADVFEFQVTAPVMGVAHPTGYPLLLLLGKLFSLVPIGTVAARVNMVSLVSGVGTVLVVTFTLWRILKLDQRIALIAGLLIGSASALWAQSVQVEAYALNNLMVQVILAVALWLGLHYRSAKPEHRKLAHRWLAVSAALGALGIANHLTIVWVYPAILMALILSRPKLSFKQWLTAASAALIVIPVLAYIPLRWPAVTGGQAMGVQQFFYYISGLEYTADLQADAWLTDPVRWQTMFRLLVDQFTWAGLALAALGLPALFYRFWRAGLITLILALGSLWFGFNFFAPEVAGFLLPFYTVVGIWAAVAAHYALRFCEFRLPAHLNNIAAGAWLSAFLFIPLAAFWTNGPAFDWSAGDDWLDWGRYALSADLAEGSVIFADPDRMAPIEYLRRIEGMGPEGLEATIRYSEADLIREMNRRIGLGDAVYLARYLPGLEGAYYLRNRGPLIEVGTEAIYTLPDDARASRLNWQEGLSLRAYRLDADPLRAGESAHLTLYWQADETLTRNAQIRLRLLDQSGQLAWENIPAAPVSGRYPLVAWKDSETVYDYHPLALPRSLPPGDYQLEVALTPPFSEEAFPLNNGADWATISLIHIEPADQPGIPNDAQRVALSVPGAGLTHIAYPPLSPAGLDLSLTGVWRIDGEPMMPRWTSSTPSTGQPVSLESIGLDDLLLTVTPSEDGLAWSLRGDKLRCGWLLPFGDACLLGETILQGEVLDDALGNLENKVLLTDIDYTPGAILPGQALEVTLNWQALQDMDANYTVFIQLYGPDGQIHGQVDNYPVQSTYLTSQWQPGEVLTDPHVLYLDEDAPTGAYSLLIGMYLLGTDTRLQVVDVNGAIVDDKIVIDGLFRP